MKIKGLKLEDHPEYLDFAILCLQSYELKLRVEGYKEEDIQSEIEEYKKTLGL